ncbi:recombinase RecU [Aneurinibacillus migulanus]|uniref:Holliday junction resolvase RecU n=1 Tax=Aneurinibacillus migulanus TaxID=47500 RepID=UPI0005BE67EB|nr:Holliday junction resolvase RecU [Aneurinibacillus migulanus]KIV55029.1 recombinase RecU [Aneurinibacillus migulanus]KPD09428.1 recombinase RecU [Aneurinibacillus migulanus]CEH29473.1 Holliday junction resolvase RecU (R ecombination protein U homolog) [Aneurinibacillus migulanus]
MSHANRGMAFEQRLDYTNQLYENKGIAVINKRPTPIQVLSRTGNKVVGHFKKPSTVDYDGTYAGRSIVFEAKSTKELRRFPLGNIHQHQMDYLRKCHECGAIGFLLIEFATHQKVYLLPYEVLAQCWQGSKKGDRGAKSIPLQDIKMHGYEVHSSQVPVDYLTVVGKVWGIGKIAI